VGIKTELLRCCCVDAQRRRRRLAQTGIFTAWRWHIDGPGDVNKAQVEA